MFWGQRFMLVWNRWLQNRYIQASALAKCAQLPRITFGGIGRKAKFSLLSHKADVRLFQRSLSRSVLLFGVLCARRGTPRTRAPHLLLVMSTGHFSVRLNRFIHRSIAASGAPVVGRNFAKWSRLATWGASFFLLSPKNQQIFGDPGDNKKRLISLDITAL